MTAATSLFGPFVSRTSPLQADQIRILYRCVGNGCERLRERLWMVVGRGISEEVSRFLPDYLITTGAFADRLYCDLEAL